jgi:hypothetical protein
MNFALLKTIFDLNTDPLNSLTGKTKLVKSQTFATRLKAEVPEIIADISATNWC